MIQATTPTLTLTLPKSIDLTGAENVLVTFQQYDKTLTKALGVDVELADKNVISVWLSQSETLAFVPNKVVNVQVNWLDNGARIATDIGKINLKPNLIAEVIEE